MNASSNVGPFQTLTTARLITIVVAAVVVGAGVRLLNDFYLYPLWFNLDGDRPLADWLLARGFGEVAVRWRVIYHYLPEWLLGVVLGLGIGRTLGRNWWVGAVPCALAIFVAVHVLFCFAGEESLYSMNFLFGTSVAVQMILFEAAAPLLHLLAAYLTSRLARTKES